MGRWARAWEGVGRLRIPQHRWVGRDRLGWTHLLQEAGAQLARVGVLPVERMLQGLQEGLTHW